MFESFDMGNVGRKNPTTSSLNYQSPLQLSCLMYHRLPRPPPSRSQLPRLLIYTPHNRRNKQFLFHVTITISNEGFKHEDQSCINTKPPPELAHRDSRAAKVGKRHTRGTERAEKGQEYERKQEKKNIKKEKMATATVSAFTTPTPALATPSRCTADFSLVPVRTFPVSSV